MAAAQVRRIWCTTCGSYVEPGTHAIKVPQFGSPTGRVRDISRDCAAERSRAASPGESAIAATAAAVLAIAWLAVVAALVYAALR